MIQNERLDPISETPLAVFAVFQVVALALDPISAVIQNERLDPISAALALWDHQ